MEQRSLAPIEILLVEDNPDDVALTVRSFKKARMQNRISVAEDGVEGLAFLRREGKYADAPRPDIILLDLNLPRMNGHELLEIIKTDPALKDIPVIILTTSKSEEDVLSTYKLHSNCFITKPVLMEDFDRVIRTIQDFWFVVVKLPSSK
ncbi:MAG TPA: response regulator [Elusimicrobia bacterium]|nr:MAG: response regulator [Elusimicrobia bacterium GWD2_63_28]HCC47912.1 response regulator [Elusimicrobiota bacterium]